MATSPFNSAILQDIEDTLELLLPRPEQQPAAAMSRLAEAIRYSALAGGKRLRPYLTVCSADLFGVPRRHSLRAGVAIEMVHCYSLVHDDLPAMDDSPLRRGRPTSHVKYDEATAVLVGDALLTGAFEILANPATHSDLSICCELVVELAEAAGSSGMVGGQMMDILSERGAEQAADIELLQSLKTGALIRSACRLGTILGSDAAGAEERLLLDTFAKNLGLAFQITDDLLDLNGSASTAGKPTGQDALNDKSTFVDLLGSEGARIKAQDLIDEARDALSRLPGETALLMAVADFVLERDQ